MNEGAIREYLPHFTYALMKAGATQATIKSFRAYWNALPPRTAKLPCPLCYAVGRQGWLQTIQDTGGLPSVQCDRCRKQFFNVRAH